MLVSKSGLLCTRCLAYAVQKTSKAAAAAKHAQAVDDDTKPTSKTRDMTTSFTNADPVLSVELASTREQLKQVGCSTPTGVSNR
jgi:hypothetical protein